MSFGPKPKTQEGKKKGEKRQEPPARRPATRLTTGALPVPKLVVQTKKPRKVTDPVTFYSDPGYQPGEEDKLSEAASLPTPEELEWCPDWIELQSESAEEEYYNWHKDKTWKSEYVYSYTKTEDEDTRATVGKRRSRSPTPQTESTLQKPDPIRTYSKMATVEQLQAQLDAKEAELKRTEDSLRKHEADRVLEREDAQKRYEADLQRKLKDLKEVLTPDARQFESMSEALKAIRDQAGKTRAKGANMEHFNGISDNIFLWLDRLENYFSIHNVTEDDQKIQIALSYMKGQAYHSMKHLAQSNNWMQFKTEAEKNFAGEQQMFVIRQLLEAYKYKPKQNIEEYLTQKLSLASRCKLSTSETCQSIVSGLSPPLKANVLSQKPAMNLPDVLTAVRLAATTENLRKEGEATKNVSFLQSSEDSDDSKYLGIMATLQAMTGEIKKSQEINKDNADKKKDRPPAVSSSNRDIICYNCHKPGHYQSGCPQLPQGGNRAIGRGRGRGGPRPWNNSNWGRRPGNDTRFQPRPRNNYNNYPQRTGPGNNNGHGNMSPRQPMYAVQAVQSPPQVIYVTQPGGASTQQPMQHAAAVQTGLPLN